MGGGASLAEPRDKQLNIFTGVTDRSLPAVREPRPVSAEPKLSQETTLAEVRRAAPADLHSTLDSFYQGFLEVLVFTSIWLATGLASLTLLSAHVMGLPFDLRPFLLVFFSALFVYNLDHVADRHVEGIPDKYTDVFFQRPAVLVLLVASAIATGLTVSTAPEGAKWAFALYISAGLIYGFPIFPVPRKAGWKAFRLKDIPGLKAWLVAAAVTTAGWLLPIAWAQRPLDTAAWHLGLFMFVFVVSAAHMCDVADVESDRASGILTLPVHAGVERTKARLHPRVRNPRLRGRVPGRRGLARPAHESGRTGGRGRERDPQAESGQPRTAGPEPGPGRVQRGAQPRPEVAAGDVLAGGREPAVQPPSVEPPAAGAGQGDRRFV